MPLGNRPPRTACCGLPPALRDCLRPLAAAALMSLAYGGPAQAQQDDPIGEALSLPKDDPALETPEQKRAPTAFADEQGPRPVLNWGEGDGKSHLIPALDILGFQAGLNLVDRQLYEEDFNVTFDSIGHNLTHGWTTDNDPFSINQFGHPYQGSMYFGFARSAGLDYWTSYGYAFAGSLVWEYAGETTTPSINDQYTTPIAGSFLGEPLFRLSSLLLESGSGRPGFWRELGAAIISPATGTNRLLYGDRFDGVFRSHDPAVYTRFDLGVNVASDIRSDVNRNPNADEPPIPQGYKTGEALADFTVIYGMPGKTGYRYDRPFDYFVLQATAASSNALENVMVRGLLVGTEVSAGDHYRGLWGLFGQYDYLAPQLFRVSTTGASVGTVGQAWLSRNLAVETSVLAGVGYGSGGAIHAQGDRDYHNGITPQALANVRMVYGDRLSLDMTARGYHISDLASEEEGHENIGRLEASLTFRVFNLHGLTLKYVTSTRSARYADRADTSQTVNAFSIGYTLLGQTHGGTVDWRPADEAGI